MIREAIARLVEGHDLSPQEAAGAMESILAGQATDAQIAAFAVALRMKGETVQEVTGLARAMRDRASPLPLSPEIERGALLDTCGTGGDGAHTFNVSTAVALVAAGAGARVAKHGNRAVSSRSGSADVLRELGLRLDLDPEQCAACLEETGITFLFAPAFHGALRHAAAPRRELALRTVFNVLGPLCNPAGAGRQLVGVFDARWLGPLARVLAELGARAACLVHSEDGLDEISVFAPTRMVWLDAEGGLREEILNPATHGLAHRDRAPIAGGDAAASAALLRRVLEGEDGPARDVVLLNAAAALVVAGLAGDLDAGLEASRSAIDDGAARARLDALVAFHARQAAPSDTETAGGGASR